MSEINTGGPAFPIAAGGALEDGMTMRDFFAAHALAGLVVGRSMYPIEWAEAAYEMADAMLAAREKGGAA